MSCRVSVPAVPLALAAIAWGRGPGLRPGFLRCLIFSELLSLWIKPVVTTTPCSFWMNSTIADGLVIPWPNASRTRLDRLTFLLAMVDAPKSARAGHQIV